MPSKVSVDLFVEDRAHELFLGAVIRRLAIEGGRAIEVRPRSAIGGHPRALAELDIYQTSVDRGVISVPDILVVAIDANCKGYSAAQKVIVSRLVDPLSGRAVAATPDPHIERWFMADLDAFHSVVGVRPNLTKNKCERLYYKHVLARAVRDAGIPATLGGVELAAEIVTSMNLYRAGKSQPSFGHFINNFRKLFKSLC